MYLAYVIVLWDNDNTINYNTAEVMCSQWYFYFHFYIVFLNIVATLDEDVQLNAI